MIRTLFRAALVLLGLAAPALAQTQTIGISGLPVATAVNPATDYALGIVQQLNPAGMPFFVTAKVPLSKLVGPAGTPAYLAGVNVTTLAPGAQATGSVGGASPNYVLNLGIPAGPANAVLGSGTFAAGDFVLASGSGYGVVDGGAPGAAAFKPLSFFAQAANNLSDLTSPAAARSALQLAAVAASGSASDLGAGTLPAARLPAPTASSLGGVQAATAPTNTFGTGVATNGVPTFAQPSFSNLSGSATAAQMPAFTGDVSSSAGSTATTLASTGVSAGTYGSTTTVPVITVDAKGRITSASAASAAGTGTVTSVAVAGGSDESVSGSPVTSSGTITISRATQAANTVFAGPASGANAAPSYRALAAADIPSTLNAPALGAATATTAGSGDNSTKVETTAFSASYAVRGDIAQNLSAAQKAQAFANLGGACSFSSTSFYCKMPGGLVSEGGSSTFNSSGGGPITLPLACPTAVISVTASAYLNSTSTALVAQVANVTLSSIQINGAATSGSSVGPANGNTFYWHVDCY